MMYLIVSCLLAPIIGSSTPPLNDFQAIEKVVSDFVQSGDTRDLVQMERILDAHFRAIINRQMGNENVMILDRNTYLAAMKAGKIGGDERTIDIISIEILDHNAMVRVALSGSKMNFESFLQLIKDEKGQWTILSDLPKVTVLKD